MQRDYFLDLNKICMKKIDYFLSAPLDKQYISGDFEGKRKLSGPT